jgi:hypothetical protein
MLAAGLCFGGAFPVMAEPLTLVTGATTTIGVGEMIPDCATVQEVADSNVQRVWEPLEICNASPTGAPQLETLTVSAVSTGFFGERTYTSLQNLSAAAKLVREVQIPEPEEELYSTTLRTQIATEVAWSGGFVIAGTPSTYAQITATLQVRDLVTGLVVASNTFFTERFDSEFALPADLGLSGLADALNQVDAVDVSDSSGADVTALLRRGRNYAIELEAKCEVGVPAFGFGLCLFHGDAGTVLGVPFDNPLADILANDGFGVAPIEVTVDSDPVEDALNRI